MSYSFDRDSAAPPGQASFAVQRLLGRPWLRSAALLGAGGLILAGIAAIVWAAVLPNMRPAAPATPPVTDEPSPAQPANGEPDPAAVGRPVDRRPGIVWIEALGRQPDHRRLGAGFFVSPQLVVTCRHVLAGAEQVRIGLHDGRWLEPAALATVSADDDLAILQLPDPVAGAAVLPLADRPLERLAAVWAVGHPRGAAYTVRAGQVRRVLQTSDLPANSQAFLAAALESQAQRLWIEHSAGLSDGNSGGPLLDEGGQVAGINVWVDDDAGLGYALEVGHLRALLDQPGLAGTAPRRAPGVAH